MDPKTPQTPDANHLEGHPYRSGFSVSYRHNLSNEEGSSLKESFSVITPKGLYSATSILARGDLAAVYCGDCLDGEHVGQEVSIKIALDAADNDLLLNEARSLQLLSSSDTPQKKQIPLLLDQFQTSSGQAGTILRYIEGYDGLSILQKYPQGVPAEHLVWMLRRLLSVLGFCHSQGVIHGNIEPAHIVVRPRDHNVSLIDWCYSIIAPAKSGLGFLCANPVYSAPEVFEKKPPLPASDLYSLGKSAIALLGGDVKTDTLPENVPEGFGRFLKFLVRKSPLQRAQDAWEMYEELGRLRKKIYGSHRFLPFAM